MTKIYLNIVELLHIVNFLYEKAVVVRLAVYGCRLTDNSVTIITLNIFLKNIFHIDYNSSICLINNTLVLGLVTSKSCKYC